MAEIKNNTLPNSFSEAVCIDAGRVYDSCCDRDCFEDLRCFFTPRAQEIVDQAMTVRIRNAEVLDVIVDVEPITFNRGYYSCDLTFFFLVELDVFSAPHSKPCTVKGVCFQDKKVILYGSEGNVKVFSNEFALAEEADRQVRPTTNLPKCVVQTVDPIPLAAKISEVKNCYEDVRSIPNCVCERLGGDINLNQQNGDKTVYVTLGLFSIVQLVRNVQMLVPVYDFCIPEKQCDDSIEPVGPCEIFKKIKFPTEDFFPPRAGRPDGCFSCDSEEEDGKK
ncbi:MAG TPA: hypothetical protein GXX17_02925 [Clostridiales bacterium]|nr:hypothetical protein [Clostridiales bacterium]